MHQTKVLIVEDDAALREALSDTLELAGIAVSAVADAPAALASIERQDIGMVVSDVQMPNMDGHALLRKIRSERPDLPVVLMTAYGTVEKAVDAMRSGARDYLLKPFEADELVSMVERYLPMRAMNDDGPVAEDPVTRQLLTLAARVAESDATVMITGESGSGKEVFARYIHDNSSRANGPFVAINCAAIPENMLEAVLFGYEKGAFTGAYQSRPGKFEQAQGGTLLLDEISEMDLALQAKLLRVLQEREVERLGGREVIGLNVRVLATSNRAMREEVAAGRFREDLFYRLNVFPLPLRPLRDRPADILPIARRLIERHCPAGRPVPDLCPQAAKMLLAHNWSGNVRELENLMQRALILMSGDCIDVADLHFEGADGSMPTLHDAPLGDDAVNAEKVLGSHLKDHEHQLILDALSQGNGSRKNAAEKLGISPRTLRYKLARMREAGIAIPA